jgi:hypothetical protein
MNVISNKNSTAHTEHLFLDLDVLPLDKLNLQNGPQLKLSVINKYCLESFINIFTTNGDRNNECR